MKHAKTRALYDYWNSIREGRLAPFRSEIEPREIAPLLDSTFILEVQSRDSVRFRLAGTRLCESFGMELRGMSALALWHGECRAKVRDVMHRVVTEPCIGHVACTVENRGGFHYQAEFLYLPLRSDMGEMTRILGCGYYTGENRAFSKLYDPIHHWVDKVRLFELTGDSFEGVGTAPIFGRRAHDRRGEPSVPHSLEPFAASQILAGGRPELKAINGGLLGATEQIIETQEPIERSRGHLRLVKSDVG